MEFRILGSLELVDDGRPLELAGGRQRALLALLLLHANEVVSSDRLIDGLWGEQPPATAAKVLQNAVSQVRRQLGDELIVTRAPGYLLRVEPETIDARRFESLLEEGRRELAAGRPAEAAGSLRDALALWRGPPLDEFAYEPFAQAEVARLEELRLRALEERIDADLALGRHADLVGELERLVAEQPLRERPRGQLMLALYQSGRQGEALQAYQDGRRLLAEELGLEPGTALQQLEKQILTQDPALAPPALVPLSLQQPPPEEPKAEQARERRSRWLVPALAAVAAAAVALVAALLFTRDDEPAPTVVPNSLVKIDPDNHEIVGVYRVGDAWKPAVVGDYVFVTSRESQTLSRIDARTGELDTIGRLPSPSGVAAGADDTFWVGTFDRGNRISQHDTDTYQLQLLAPPGPGCCVEDVAVGGGFVWAANGPEAQVSRFDARTGEFQRRYRYPFATGGQYAPQIAFGEGAAWAPMNGPAGAVVLRIDALGGGANPLDRGEVPFAVAVGLGAVWLTDLVRIPLLVDEPETGLLLRMDPETGRLEDLIPVGKRPSGVAVGGGYVWVANGGEKSIWKIDPRTNDVVDTIQTRYYAPAVAYGHGHLWVTLSPEPFHF